jgi:hypothetical protein
MTRRRHKDLCTSAVSARFARGVGRFHHRAGERRPRRSSCTYRHYGISLADISGGRPPNLQGLALASHPTIPRTSTDLAWVLRAEGS